MNDKKGKLCFQILNGAIAPQDLVKMTTEELARDDLKKTREVVFIIFAQ